MSMSYTPSLSDLELLALTFCLDSFLTGVDGTDGEDEEGMPAKAIAGIRGAAAATGAATIVTSSVMTGAVTLSVLTSNSISCATFPLSNSRPSSSHEFDFAIIAAAMKADMSPLPNRTRPDLKIGA